MAEPCVQLSVPELLVRDESMAVTGVALQPDDPAAAHVPSPRQNVEDVAPVPLLRCDTARFPVTPVASGSPVALVNVRDEGVPPAPPLTTNAPALPVLTPRAVTTPVPAAAHPITVLLEL